MIDNTVKFFLEAKETQEYVDSNPSSDFQNLYRLLYNY